MQKNNNNIVNNVDNYKTKFGIEEDSDNNDTRPEGHNFFLPWESDAKNQSFQAIKLFEEKLQKGFQYCKGIIIP